MKLSYEEYGSGRPLVVIHGLFGSADNWRSLAGKLGEDFHVLAVDLRNHGKSPHDDRMGYDVMAQDLLELTDDLNLDPVHVLGHSMGGKVAMQFAGHNPERVDRLIIVDVTPRAYEARHDHILEAMKTLRLADIGSRNEALEALSDPVPHLAVRQFLLKNLEPGGDGTYRWRLNLDAISRHYDHLNDEIFFPASFSKPALFIRGEESDYIADGDRDLIKSLFPASRIVTVKRAGHWVHADAPETFYEIVREFLTP